MSKYQWGLGIEHEYHLFHIKKNRKAIVFPTQEIICNLTKHYDFCCKYNVDSVSKNIYKHLCCDFCRNYEKKDVTDCWPKETLTSTNKIKLTQAEKNFLILKWPNFEYSGRIECPNIPRIKSNMIEAITLNYKNKQIKIVVKELINKEEKLIKILNKYSKQKINFYGQIRQHSFGTIQNCKVPKVPTLINTKYKFIKTKCLDYTGSYHINITLPWIKQTRLDTFIKQHQEFARQIQWIEPLIVSSFSSTDPRAIGDSNKYTEGSYRVMTIGWGSFAASDIRRIEFELIGRQSTSNTKWRQSKYQKELEKCNSIIGSDIRTISERFADKTKNEIMHKGEGIEIRIFDHFPTKYIKNLIHILIIIADNSLRNNYSKNEKHVYEDEDWIKNIRNIMVQGWNADITENYITKIKKNLDIKFECESTKTYDIFTCMVNALFEKNKDGLFQKLTKTGKKLPHIPKINRFSWEFSFNQKNLTKDLRNIVKKQKSFTVKEFKQLFYKKFDKKKWDDDFEDVLYALQSNKIIILLEKKGKIHLIENNIL